MTSITLKKTISKYKTKNTKLQAKFNNRIGIINNLICMGYFFSWFWILGIIFGLNPITGSSFAHNYFNIHSSKIAQLSSYFLIFDLISVFFVGFGMLNFSIKKIFCGAIFINIFACLGLLLSTNGGTAIVFACFYGFGGGVCVLPMLGLSSQWFSPSNQGKAISLTIGGALCGSIFARLAHSYFKIDSKIKINGHLKLFHHGQSGLPLVLTLAFLIFIFITAIIFLKEKKHLIGEHRSSIKSFGKLFCKSIMLKENWIIILFITLINLPVTVLLWSNGDSFVKHNYIGVTKSTIASSIMMILMFGNICGSFLWGVVADKLGKRKNLMMACALVICIMTFLVTKTHENVAMLYAIYFMIGFLCSVQNIGYPMLAEQNTPKLIGVTFIFNSLILLGGGAIVQQIFAKLMPQISASNPSAPPYWTTFLLPILMTIPLLVSFLIVETGPNASKRANRIIAKRKLHAEKSFLLN